MFAATDNPVLPRGPMSEICRPMRAVASYGQTWPNVTSPQRVNTHPPRERKTSFFPRISMVALALESGLI